VGCEPGRGFGLRWWKVRLRILVELKPVLQTISILCREESGSLLWDLFWRGEAQRCGQRTHKIISGFEGTSSANESDCRCGSAFDFRLMHPSLSASYRPPRIVDPNPIFMKFSHLNVAPNRNLTFVHSKAPNHHNAVPTPRSPDRPSSPHTHLQRILPPPPPHNKHLVRPLHRRH
jgi:hypothetical protein